MSFHIFCLFSIGELILFTKNELFVNIRYKSFANVGIMHILFPISGLTLHSYNPVFREAKVFNFDETYIQFLYLSIYYVLRNFPYLQIINNYFINVVVKFFIISSMILFKINFGIWYEERVQIFFPSYVDIQIFQYFMLK